MRGKTTRLALFLTLVGAASSAAAEFAVPGEELDAAESLRRAQLEQELIMAEGTATMYGDLERALLEMRDEGGTR